MSRDIFSGFGKRDFFLRKPNAAKTETIDNARVKCRATFPRVSENATKFLVEKIKRRYDRKVSRVAAFVFLSEKS